MSETLDDLKRDARKDPDDLEREADLARDAVEASLLELAERFSPSELYDRFATAVKQNGGDFGANLLTQVRNNPVPTLMAGIGIAWLMASSKRPPIARPQREGPGLTDRLSSAMDSVRGAASSAMDSVRGAADSARGSAYDVADTARHAAHATTEYASRAADATSEMAGRAADAARRTGDSLRRLSTTGAQSVTQTYSYLSREQPLLLGALAIVAGAAIGAVLPGTRAEDEWIGETSDAAKARLKAEGKQRLDDLQEAGAEIADAAREVVAGMNSGDTTVDDSGIEASSR